MAKKAKKAKGRPGAGGASPGAAQHVQPDSAFERMSHRRHFDVVGRKCVVRELQLSVSALERCCRAFHTATAANPMRASGC
jgi:hypothetical protein